PNAPPGREARKPDDGARSVPRQVQHGDPAKSGFADAGLGAVRKQVEDVRAAVAGQQVGNVVESNDVVQVARVVASDPPVVLAHVRGDCLEGVVAGAIDGQAAGGGHGVEEMHVGGQGRVAQGHPADAAEIDLEDLRVVE